MSAEFVVAPCHQVAGRVTELELRPFLDLSRFSDIERRRSLGLGYLDIDSVHPGGAQAAQFRQKALELLTGVRAQGLRDGVLEAALARVHFELGLDGVQQYAESALAYPDLAGQDRANALFLVADAYAAKKRHQDAVQALEELVTLRRESIDWLILADCHQALGNQLAYIEALATAVRIDSRLPHVHRVLGDYYRRQGKTQQAVFHERRAAE